MPFKPDIPPAKKGEPITAAGWNKMIRAIRPPVAVGGYQSDNMNLQVPGGRGRKVRQPDFPTGNIQIYVCYIGTEIGNTDVITGMGACDVYEPYTDGTLGLFDVGVLLNPFGTPVLGWGTCCLVGTAPPPSPAPSPSPGLMAEPTFRPQQFGGSGNVYMLVGAPSNRCQSPPLVINATCDPEGSGDILNEKIILNYNSATNCATSDPDDPSPSPEPSPSPGP